MALFSDTFRLPTADLPGYFATRSNVRYFKLAGGARRHVAPADRIVANEFTFNEETHRLPPDFDWKQNPSPDREWHILLHKFYYLRYLALAYDCTGDDVYARKWVELIDSWIRQVPAGFIDSQVTGRRLQQWILSWQYFVPRSAATHVASDFLLAFLHSLDEQTAYLCDHLTAEGNHRTIELYGIFLVAILFPEFRRSADYVAFAREEIRRNIETDILADGVQRELSTDYHHIVLKSFLRIRELARLNQVELGEDFDRQLRRAITFSMYVHKPEGTIPAINDSDVNDYRSLLRKSLRLFADREVEFVVSAGERGDAPAQRSRLFAASGYGILRSDWQERPFSDARYLLFDCGPPGFGTHAHYDALAIEFAAYGRSLLIDPGRYSYRESGEDGINWRHRFKSTAYHNTVVVDGMDQCEYNIGRADVAQPQSELLRFETRTGFDFVCGRVTSPRYSAVHERSLVFLPSDYCLVVDIMRSSDEHRYEQFFRLHPRALDRVSIEQGDGRCLVRSPGLLLAKADAARSSVERGFFSPRYGVREPAPVLKFAQESAGRETVVFRTLLLPFRSAAPDLILHPLGNDTLNADPALQCILKLEFENGSGRFTDYLYVAPGGKRARCCAGDLCVDAAMACLRLDDAGAVVGLHGVDLAYLRLAERVLLDRNACMTGSL